MVEQEKAKLAAVLCQTLQQAIIDLVQMRFPAIAPTLRDHVQTVSEVAQLQRLHAAVRSAPDQATVEQRLRDAVAGS